MSKEKNLIPGLQEELRLLKVELDETYRSITQLTNELNAQTREVQKSHERLELALKGADLGMWDWNMQTDQVVFNERWAQMLGYSLEEIEPSFSSWQQLIHNEDLPKVEAILKAHLEDRTPFYISEHRMQAKSGDWKWILVRGKVVERDSLNKPIRAAGTHLDISEYKHTEASLKRYQRALTLRNAIADIFLTIRGEEVYGNVLHIVLDAMKSKCGIFGYIDEDGSLSCPSMTIDVLDQCRIPDKDIVFPRAKWGGIWGNALIEKKTVYTNKPSFVPKGHIPISRALAVPIIFQGNVIGIFLVANKKTDYSNRDQKLLETISDYIAPVLNARLQKNLQEKKRRQAEDELKDHRDNLEEIVRDRTLKLEDAKRAAESANQAKSEFLANMSHELRTPLNAVLGFSEILKQREKDEKKSYFLESIQTSGEVLLSLINDVLDLSKIEAGKMELHYSAVSIHGFVREMELIFSRKAQETGLDLSIWVDPDCPEALILDETRLRQVCINLLGNAMKFTRTGFIHMRISGVFPLDAGQSRGDLTIEIEDTGRGISKDDIGEIFKVFQQIEKQKDTKAGGTGLGLTITKRLVEIMDGRISVKSEEGKGSTFIVFLPNIEFAAGFTVESKGKSPFNFETISFAPGTILIVDDINYNRELLTIFLEGYKFKFLYAENGQVAVEKARQHQPNLILLDMKMPIMDGFEAIEQLNADEQLKDIPVVAVTASVLLQDKDKISSICDGYLGKPVRKRELIQELMRFLPHTIVESPLAEEAGNTGVSGEKLYDRPTKLPSDNVLDEVVLMTKAGYFGKIENILTRLSEKDQAYTPFCQDIKNFMKKYNAEGILIYVETIRNAPEKR